MSKLKFHTLANLFPLLEGKPFDDLVADIKQHGLRDKIITLDGEILEGRNRYNACLAGKVEPETKEFRGKDPAAFVWSKNGMRRHLSPSQLGIIGAEIAIHIRDEQADEEGDEPQGDAVAKAAKMVGTSKRTVERALKLKKTNPKKAAAVKAGTTTVTEALKPSKTAQEKSDAQYQSDLTRICKICGAGFGLAVQNGTILKSRLEVKRYAELSDEEMERIKIVVQGGMTVGKARKYKMVSLSRAHKIKDLLDRAAMQGGIFTLEIEGWEINVKKAAK